MVARSSSTSRWRRAFLVIAAGWGAFLGYTFGAGYGSTDIAASFSAMVAVGLAIVILVVLAVTAALIRLKSDNRDPALRSVIRIAGLFLAGIGLGWVLSLV